MKNNFIKVGKVFFNIDYIQAVYSTSGRDYRVLVGGETFCVSYDEGIKLVKFIEENDSPEEFNPDKRIQTSTTNATESSTSSWTSNVNKIRSAVNEHNNTAYIGNEVQMTVETLSRTIKIIRNQFQSITIENNVITSDTLSDSATFRKLKNKIIEILILEES